MGHGRMKRLSLTLIPILLAGLALHTWIRERESEATRKYWETYWDDAYQRIGQGELRYESRVLELMGSNGRVIAPTLWPKTLGEMLDYTEGHKRWATAKDTYDFGKYYPFYLRPTTPIWWRIWNVLGPHKWIAVGFINDSSVGMFTGLTVAKRTGLDESLPLN